MQRLFVDDRYRGQHGIARYSSEVLRRLTVAWEPLNVGGRPGSPLDAFQVINPGDKKALVYSPGYAGFASRCRQFLTIHDLIHLSTPWPGRAKYTAYYNAIIRPTIRRAKAVFTVSETSHIALRDWIDDDTIAIVNAGNGCSAQFTRFGHAHPAPPYVLYVGNTRSHKNVGVLLSAVARIDGLQLIALIPPKEHDKARAMADYAGLHRDKLQLLSGINDHTLATFYRGATATAVPSVLEGFGLPALESVRCGTPVVYWEGCASVKEIVGARGIAVESARDPRAWSEALVSAAAGFGESLEDTRDWSWAGVAEKVNAKLAEFVA